jgi:hypothetical protein
MTEIAPKCPHANIEYDVAGLTQPGTNIIHTDIAARCADCGVLFKWQGRYSLQSDANNPFVSEDGLWLTIPMVPEDENAYRILTPTQ